MDEWKENTLKGLKLTPKKLLPIGGSLVSNSNDYAPIIKDVIVLYVIIMGRHGFINTAYAETFYNSKVMY